MIGFLRGHVLSECDGVYTIGSGVGGEVAVGYEVRVSDFLTDNFVALWTHEHAPQDAPHELYGFRERAKRDLFRRLLGVKGVGPKVALRIVGARGVTLEGIPVPSTLRSIRGVGPTLADRICEELQ